MKLTNEQDLHPCRRARIALRKVDIILKEEGVEAAARALLLLEAELKTVMITRAWIRDYKTMLEAWKSGLVQDVVNEFYAFGFRRALCAAKRPDLWKMKKFLSEYYMSPAGAHADVRAIQRPSAILRSRLLKKRPSRKSTQRPNPRYERRIHVFNTATPRR